MNGACIYLSELPVLSEHEVSICGGSGIRTHGPVSQTSVFKTDAFDHSAIPPCGEIVAENCELSNAVLF